MRIAGFGFADGDIGIPVHGVIVCCILPGDGHS